MVDSPHPSVGWLAWLLRPPSQPLTARSQQLVGSPLPSASLLWLLRRRLGASYNTVIIEAVCRYCCKPESFTTGAQSVSHSMRPQANARELVNSERTLVEISMLVAFVISLVLSWHCAWVWVRFNTAVCAKETNRERNWKRKVDESVTTLYSMCDMHGASLTIKGMYRRQNYWDHLRLLRARHRHNAAEHLPSSIYINWSSWNQSRGSDGAETHEIHGGTVLRIARKITNDRVSCLLRE